MLCVWKSQQDERRETAEHHRENVASDYIRLAIDCARMRQEECATGTATKTHISLAV